MGEVTRARETTPLSQEMQSRRPQQVQRDIPREVLKCHPDVPVQLDRKFFDEQFEERSEGILRQDAHTSICGCCWMTPTRSILFCEAASSFAQATLSSEIQRWPGPTVVRGIATGSSMRRLVARTLAKQFARKFDKECAPFQCALSIRAGTDCVGHMLRAASDRDPSATIFSVDGIGAYDHVLRRHVAEVGTDAGGTRIVAFRASLVCNTLALHLVSRSKSRRDASRGRRARGPSDAFALLHWHTGRHGRSGNHAVPQRTAVPVFWMTCTFCAHQSG